MGARYGGLWSLQLACVVFTSLFFRELLRALIGVACGRCATVCFMPLSSHTELAPQPSRMRLALLQLAGPTINLLMAVGLRLAFPGPGSRWAAAAVEFNLVWGLVCLLPILPFDGGRLLQVCLGEDRGTITMLVSVAVAEMATTLAVAGFRSPEFGLIFLLAAISSALGWHRSWRRQLDAQAAEELREARRLFQAQRDEDACLAAERIAHSECLSATRNAALALLAQAALRAGQPKRAAAALRTIAPTSEVDLLTLAEVEIANGLPLGAIRALERARRNCGFDRASARLLLDLYASVGDYQRVSYVAIDLAGLLGADDLRLVANALQAAGEVDRATYVIAASLSSIAGATRRGDGSFEAEPGLISKAADLNLKARNG
jgi:hypothetical protein